MVGRSLRAPFSATLLLGAVLLFSVEPIIGRMLLPLLGGAPAVWTTCMLFFQATLLVAYAYAHVMPHWLGVRRHALAHAVLVFAPLAALPLAFGDVSTAAWSKSSPALSLLALLALHVGFPFFVVSATTPLLQRWFFYASAGKEPYFLYVASNLGSLAALAAYPLIVEPLVGLRAQSRLWLVGYVLFAMLVAASALAVWRATPPAALAADLRHRRQPEASRALPIVRLLRWTALGFVPSSLLHGVTAYITTDVAAIPLFWVLPLALYVTSFALVFARRPPLSPRLPMRALPLGVTAAAFVLLAEIAEPGWLVLLVHLTMFFLACMVCHGEVARDRPPGDQLTVFYFTVALGGVVGGVFNALVAPLLFSQIAEYPIAIALACACRLMVDVGPSSSAPRPRRLYYAIPVGLSLLTAALVFGGRAIVGHRAGLAVAIVIGVPLLLNYAQHHRPLRFALGITGIFVGGSVYSVTGGHTVFRDRNFFGALRVTHDPAGAFVELTHGTTIHGRQSTEPARRRECLGYYHATGPLGSIFAAHDRHPAAPSVGVIGLGAGTMASYARPGDSWTFYEINPAVVRIAQDTRYFTYLADAFPQPRDRGMLTIVLGDARLRLGDAESGAYGLLVLDAFSSDAIPVHLLTREAIGLYFSKIAPHGLVALHVSNRYLDLGPVVAELARDANLAARFDDDLEVSAALLARGKTASQWVVLARSDADLQPLDEADGRWARLPAAERSRVWSDDYANLLGALRPIWGKRPE